jgi:hypothetical protein
VSTLTAKKKKKKKKEEEEEEEEEKKKNKKIDRGKMPNRSASRPKQRWKKKELYRTSREKKTL